MKDTKSEHQQYDFSNPSHTSVFIKDDAVVVSIVLAPGITNEFKFKRLQQPRAKPND